MKNLSLAIFSVIFVAVNVVSASAQTENLPKLVDPDLSTTIKRARSFDYDYRETS